MLSLNNVSLLSLQTKYMQQDPTTQALCAALDSQFHQLADEIKACLIYSRIDELDNLILDELAWQMNIDWYDTNAKIWIKRDLIKKALKVFRYRGTPYSVEEVIKSYFDEGYVQEWFEYGGDPYTFRIVANNEMVEASQIAITTRLVNKAKNVRSHLEAYYSHFICGVFECGQS